MNELLVHEMKSSLRQVLQAYSIVELAFTEKIIVMISLVQSVLRNIGSLTLGMLRELVLQVTVCSEVLGQYQAQCPISLVQVVSTNLFNSSTLEAETELGPVDHILRDKL